MECHRLTCQACGSRRMNTVLLRDADEKLVVICADCHEFVARWLLSSHGYYHEGKSFDSYLRSLERAGEAPTGRNLQAHFERLQKEARSDFKLALKQLQAEGKDF